MTFRERAPRLAVWCASLAWLLFLLVLAEPLLETPRMLMQVRATFVLVSCAFWLSGWMLGLFGWRHGKWRVLWAWTLSFFWLVIAGLLLYAAATFSAAGY